MHKLNGNIDWSAQIVKVRLFFMAENHQKMLWSGGVGKIWKQEFRRIENPI